MNEAQRIPLLWEGRKIGMAVVTMHSTDDGLEIELNDVEPIWLRTGLRDSIIKHNAYSLRRAPLEEAS